MMIQDRVRLNGENRARIVEDLEVALKHGRGRVTVTPLEGDGKPSAAWRFSSALHCAECAIAYRDPVPNFFSFNSPIGACQICGGFGRSIGIDYGLVIPKAKLFCHSPSLSARSTFADFVTSAIAETSTYRHQSGSRTFSICF